MEPQLSNGCTITDLNTYPLGCTTEAEATIFRLFSPKATSVSVIIFDSYEDESGITLPLEKNTAGIWETIIQDTFYEHWYAYDIEGPKDDPFFMQSSHPIADPLSTHVTTKNHHLQFPKTKIVPESDFNWEDDTFVAPEDPRDLIIYETHIKDMVAHSSAKTYVQGI